jgi:predicted PurR-regulated permease PerM
MLATILGPVSVLAANLADSVYWLATGVQAGTLRIPPPPPSIEKWPVIGEEVHRAWELAFTNLDEAVHKYGPVVLPAGGSVLGKIAALSADILKFVVSVIISGFLFVPGPRLAASARAFAVRLIAPRGAHFIDLAGATIRNVSRGVIGVALLQALLAGGILMLAGVPGAGLIAFAVLILCIIQIGAAPVLVPVMIWAWISMSTALALTLIVLLIPVMLIDNLLKPILMARGLTTPMLVILTGVIGGTITHGLIGLFLGPVVLAVFYELVVAWTRLGAVPVEPDT